MNFPLLRLVLDSDLPCSQRMIMIVLINHANDSGKAWPSQETIAKQSGLTSRSVRDNLAILVESKWLTRSQSTGRGFVYLLREPEPASGLTGSQFPPDRKPFPVSDEDDRKLVPVRPEAGSGQTGNGFPSDRKQFPPNNPRTTQELPINNPDGDGEPPPPPKVKASKPDWREFNRDLAEKANLVSPPLLCPDEFRKSWRRYQIYRTNRAVEARISSDAIAWTPDAAEAAMRSCERASDAHGWPTVCAQIDNAINGRWQGLNFDKMPTPKANGRQQAVSDRRAREIPTVHTAASLPRL